METTEELCYSKLKPQQFTSYTLKSNQSTQRNKMKKGFFFILEMIVIIGKMYRNISQYTKVTKVIEMR